MDLPSHVVTALQTMAAAVTISILAGWTLTVRRFAVTRRFTHAYDQYTLLIQRTRLHSGDTADADIDRLARDWIAVPLPDTRRRLLIRAGIPPAAALDGPVVALADNDLRVLAALTSR
jgi:hypothetical protein